MNFQAKFCKVGFGDGLSAEWRGTSGEWLSWSSLFAWDVRCGDGAVFDGKQRRAGDAIEEKDAARLGNLSNGIALFATMGNRYEVRTGGEIVVPEVVAGSLKMPDAAAGCCIEAESAVGEE